MKRILLFVLLVGVVLALSSCNVMLGWIMADKMVLDGDDEYELAELYLDYYGNPDGPHQFHLVIVSDGIDWGETTISGDGDVILVAIASPDRDLADGMYEYSSASTLDDFDMVGGFVWLGYDWDGSDPADEFYTVVDGTVDVKKLFNDEYLVRMELELDDYATGDSGPDLELYFQGEISAEYDYSGSSSSITEPLESRGLSTW